MPKPLPVLALVSERIAWLRSQRVPCPLEAIRDARPAWYRGTDTAYLRLASDLADAGLAAVGPMAVRR